jgi:hypothetical protein
LSVLIAAPGRPELTILTDYGGARACCPTRTARCRGRSRVRPLPA